MDQIKKDLIDILKLTPKDRQDAEEFYKELTKIDVKELSLGDK